MVDNVVPSYCQGRETYKQMPILMFICNLGHIKVNKIITKYNLHNLESPAWHINILHRLRYI